MRPTSHTMPIRKRRTQRTQPARSERADASDGGDAVALFLSCRSPRSLPLRTRGLPFGARSTSQSQPLCCPPFLSLQVLSFLFEHQATIFISSLIGDTLRHLYIFNNYLHTTKAAMLKRCCPGAGARAGGEGGGARHGNSSLIQAGDRGHRWLLPGLVARAGAGAVAEEGEGGGGGGGGGA